MTKLRQVKVLHGHGLSMVDAVRQIGISQHMFYRWRKQSGEMNRAQLSRRKDLEKEKERRRRAVSDLTLENLVLTEAARGNF
ncbi:transposase [Rhodovulum sulfidophilum]|uniref:transposase n=1 Tax=Rhodovulum sulfidophilum TaxID=35806 RepID=UPI001925E231|nr:transposase [Rhodovulum sulfidophilum]